MKHLCLILVLLLGTITTNANQMGHFSKQVADENIPVHNIGNHFEQWFALPPSTTFEKVADKTDNMGIRHISYQQFYNGICVEGSLVLVHAKGNKVHSLNGVIMERQLQPKSTVAKLTKRKAVAKVRTHEDDNAELLLTPIHEGETVSYRIAYKVYSPEKMADIYIDAETGEVLKEISTVQHALSAQANALTMYSGTQTVNCTYDNNTYALTDTERGIVTYIGSNIPQNIINYYDPNVLSAIENFIDTTTLLTAEQRNDPKYMEYFKRTVAMESFYIPIFNQHLSIPTSTTVNFSGAQIATVSIEAINTTSWQGLFEVNPDLYITIEDVAGIERFNNKESRITRTPSASNPVTFTVNIPVWGDGYVLKIWDYDAVGGDDLIEVSKNINRNKGTHEVKGLATSTIVIADGVASPILDAHWGMEKTMDFFAETFGRNSFDDMGSIVYQIVDVPNHVIEGGNNAFASRNPGVYSYMVYGMGDGVTMRPLVELDVMAHEFSHQITYFNQTGGLKYENESGAMNEGFSDIFGMCVEYYATGTASWLIGHDIMIGATNMRSMKNPANSEDGKRPQPKAYMGTNWVPSTTQPDSKKNDNGGVHTNSGVLNFWFYLLSTGTTNYTNEFGYTFSVNGIGIEKAQLIAYMLNQYCLTPYATYEDAYWGSLICAEILYGYGSAEYQAVQNAWGCVGLGNGYQGTLYQLQPGTYMVFARRNDTSDYFKMAAELTTGSTKRYKAVGIGDNYIGLETTAKQDSAFIWEVEKSGDTFLLKNKNLYSTWNSGNSAALAATGKPLTITPNTDGSYSVAFEDGTNTRYLSLNKTVGNDYFAYYAGTGQMVNLRFEPYHYTEVPEITVKAKMPADWGNTISAWVWNTGEDGAWVNLTKNGDWYEYTTHSYELNIVYVNGTDWNGDNNQTVDITTTGSACYQIEGNTTGKRTYTAIDCIERQTPALTFEQQTISIEVGEQQTLTATTNSDAEITYASSNTNVAIVDKDGNVTGIAAGNAQIIASVQQTNRYNAATATCNVSVTATQVCKTPNYSETFADTQGDFTIQEVFKADGLSYIWKLDESSYKNGMVAKAMYSGTRYESEGWLISPCIELPENATTNLTFDHTAKFFENAENELTLWISTNYKTGLPSTATWSKLNIPTYPSGANWSFVNSGEIDLSTFAGESITFAFKFCSTSTIAPQWEIKNVSVTTTTAPTTFDNVALPSHNTEKVLIDGILHIILPDGKVFNPQGIRIK